MSRQGRIYNLKKDVLDGSEEKFGADHHMFKANRLPHSFDLHVTSNCVPPILDQGQLGACGPNQLSNALRYCIGKENNACAEWQPSRLYIYYFTRLLEGSPINEDTGISIKGGIEAIAKYSACSEKNWPYDISKFAKTPSLSAIKAAYTHLKGFKGLSVPQNLVHIKQALIAGYPIVFGIQIYESFESDEVAMTGIVPMPNIKKEAHLGGHAISIWSWNDETQTFGCQNSWSKSWAINGYFTIPYDYVLNPKLASDLWTCRYFK